LRRGRLVSSRAIHHIPAERKQRLYRAMFAAGFTGVDCFWKRLRRALVGGFRA
jgi:hypothetical protein